MHECIIFERGKFRKEECEMKWDIILYLYVHLRKGEVDKVELCIHEVYRLTEDYEKIVGGILGAKYSDTISLFNSIVKILNNYCGRDWKTRFDISMNEHEVQFNVLL